MRPTPFGLVFADLAAERFPAIGAPSADRDHFVLLEPVGRLLRDIVPQDSEGGPDALEAHVRLLHHAYRHWAAGGWVYRIGERALERATNGSRIASHLPQQALYLQLPELRVWGVTTPGGLPEPLDGVFVSETSAPGGIAVLGIFGMRPDRAGFSAVGVEGHADIDDPVGTEIEVAAARDDGSAAFGPTLAGGAQAGLYSLANAGELLLLTCRLLATLPAPAPASAPAPGGMGTGDQERFVAVT
jgi:hypothetical protein